MSDLAPTAGRVEHVRRDFARCDCGCAPRVQALADALAEVIAAVRDLDGLAPVVTIARGPLDYQPDPEITLATVVPDDATADWWRSHVAPLSPEEEGA